MSLHNKMNYLDKDFPGISQMTFLNLPGWHKGISAASIMIHGLSVASYTST